MMTPEEKTTALQGSTRWEVFTCGMRRISIGYGQSEPDAWRAAQSNLIDKALRQTDPA